MSIAQLVASLPNLGGGVVGNIINKYTLSDLHTGEHLMPKGYWKRARRCLKFNNGEMLNNEETRDLITGLWEKRQFNRKLKAQLPVKNIKEKVKKI